jgi:hypothetical protein
MATTCGRGRAEATGTLAPETGDGRIAGKLKVAPAAARLWIKWRRLKKALSVMRGFPSTAETGV